MHDFVPSFAHLQFVTEPSEAMGYPMEEIDVRRNPTIVSKSALEMNEVYEAHPLSCNNLA